MNKKMLQAIIIRLNEIKKGYQVDDDLDFLIKEIEEDIKCARLYWADVWAY